MFGDLFSGSPAHLRWIAGVLKLARNANRIGAIFNSFASKMDRIVLMKCQFSLACDEICKKKEQVEEDENSKKVLVATNASRANNNYFVRRAATSSRGTLSFAILGVGNCGKN